MGIVNRRNAVVGWVVLKAGKVFAKQKARQTKGALAFWRRKRG